MLVLVHNPAGVVHDNYIRKQFGECTSEDVTDSTFRSLYQMADYSWKINDGLIQNRFVLTLFRKKDGLK